MSVTVVEYDEELEAAATVELLGVDDDAYEYTALEMIGEKLELELIVLEETAATELELVGLDDVYCVSVCVMVVVLVPWVSVQMERRS